MPVLLREKRGEHEPEINPWEAWLAAMLHMSNASNLFVARADADAGSWELRGNRFYKGKDTLLPLYCIRNSFTCLIIAGLPCPDAKETRSPFSARNKTGQVGYAARYWVNEGDCLVIAAKIFRNWLLRLVRFGDLNYRQGQQ